MIKYISYNREKHTLKSDIFYDVLYEPWCKSLTTPEEWEGGGGGHCLTHSMYTLPNYSPCFLELSAPELYLTAPILWVPTVMY